MQGSLVVELATKHLSAGSPASDSSPAFQTKPGSEWLVVTAATLVMAMIPGEEVENHRFFYYSVFGSLAGNS